MPHQTSLMNIFSNLPKKNPTKRQRRRTKEEYQDIDTKSFPLTNVQRVASNKYFKFSIRRNPSSYIEISPT